MSLRTPEDDKHAIFRCYWTDKEEGKTFCGSIKDLLTASFVIGMMFKSTRGALQSNILLSDIPTRRD